MTALQLALWIVAAITAQLLLFGAVAFQRRRRALHALREHASDGS